VGDEVEDLAFAVGQLGERRGRLGWVLAAGELGDQEPGDAGGDQRVAGGDDFDCVQQLARAGFFEQEAAGAGA
jgi:hypothetical protein